MCGSREMFSGSVLRLCLRVSVVHMVLDAKLICNYVVRVSLVRVGVLGRFCLSIRYISKL